MLHPPYPSPLHPDAPRLARTLGERYLDAATSPEEEAWLLGFLTSPAGAAEEFRELRAVLTFTAMGRRQHTLRPAVPAAAPKHSRRRTLVWRCAAAVAVVALACTALWTMRPDGTSESTDICVAYVGGERITDEARVMALMQESMAEVEAPECDDLLRSELSDMLRP